MSGGKSIGPARPQAWSGEECPETSAATQVNAALFEELVTQIRSLLSTGETPFIDHLRYSVGSAECITP